MTATLSLQRQLCGALRDVLSAEDQGASPVARFGSLVKAARTLFRSDAAYLAIPESPTGTNYFFASLSNVHTSPFRALRMEFGQGLGGLARTEGRVVSSTNYSRDHRLQAALVSETGGEGIVSAMAAPLMQGSSVRGVLYVASRAAQPFSPTDELVMGELADYFALMMDQPGFMSATRAAHADRMREDFAHAIHDSVVRSLVQIGFTAEQAARTTSGADVSSIDLIRRAAEEALSNLREELSGLVSETVVDAVELPDLLAKIVDIPKRAGVHRDILILGAAGEAVVSAQVAEALIHVGVEALTNSERHSQANTETVEASSTESEVTVRIVDDGRGSPILGLTCAQLSAMGHLGVASMHRRIEAVDGTLSIESSVGGGTTVTITVSSRN